MGMLDKIKDFMNVQDDDLYDEENYDSDYTEEPSDAQSYDEQPSDDRDLYSDRNYSSSRYSSRSSDKKRDYSRRDRDYSRSSDDAKRNKYVNIHATTQLQVVLVKPESFQDATSIADHLNAKRTVVLNLESTNKDIARRLVDFLSGVAYANQGQLKKVANSTFIVTPFNVDIMGDLLLDELENSGLYM